MPTENVSLLSPSTQYEIKSKVKQESCFFEGPIEIDEDDDVVFVKEFCIPANEVNPDKKEKIKRFNKIPSPAEMINISKEIYDKQEQEGLNEICVELFSELNESATGNFEDKH